jgi:hypothetical protein
MNPTIHQKIRSALHANPDGLTPGSLMSATGIHRDSIYPALKDIPDTYIDRWDTSGRQLAAVWVAVIPPDDCPRPEVDR